jgi:hypothetical protein
MPIIHSAERYTVREAVEDWLTKGLKDRDPATITNNRILAERHVIPLLGRAKLKDLRADQVDEWPDGLVDKLASDSLGHHPQGPAESSEQGAHVRPGRSSPQAG